ncbi:MAG TPA: alpha/beta fold hydrolase [Pseudonocardia sp.]|jgi:pimeloyl-ACP methyl ester carboxylesterase|nr:alpha/beta fold hydrolase [Pseudonocardia sp.]
MIFEAGRRLGVLGASALLVAGLAGCGVSSTGTALADLHPCSKAELGDIGADPPGVVPNVPVTIAFHCGSLDVPLDHGLLPGPKTDGRLTLQVSVADNADAPRGVLVWLVGGPGEPGVPLTADITSGFDPAVLRDYRLVFISGRGTGENALNCPALQAGVGDSDFAVPPPGSIAACAQAIGDNRRFYATADTAADLDLVRRALGVDKISLDGASYGSFVAERYAITYPDHVSRLVLDSVVPHDGFDMLNIGGFARTAEVLRLVCREIGCTTDPASDLSEVVRNRHDGVALLDTIGGLSSGKPDLAGVPAALHSAVLGDPGALDAMVAQGRKDAAITAEHLSQGLHTTAICQDMPGPWGDASTPMAGRVAAAGAVVAKLPDSAFFPYDRDTALGNGQMVACEQWPTVPVVPFPPGRNLPNVPVLVLAGDHDLNTPLSDAQTEVAHAPQGHLVIIPGSGHITQDHANGAGGREAVRQFLTN